MYWEKHSINEVNGPTILFWTSYPSFQYYVQFGDPHVKMDINKLCLEDTLSDYEV